MVFKFIIFASEVGSLLNLNPYKNRYETFINIWNRCIKEDFILDESDVSSKETSDSEEEEINKVELEDILINNQTVNNFVEQISNHTNTTDLENELNNLESIIEPILKEVGEVNKENVIQIIKSKSRCAFGTKNETSAINTYEEKSHSKINKRNDKFYKKIIYSCPEYNIIVGGKVDGIKDDNTVVEVKIE